MDVHVTYLNAVAIHGEACRSQKMITFTPSLAGCLQFNITAHGSFLTQARNDDRGPVETWTLTDRRERELRADGEWRSLWRYLA